MKNTLSHSHTIFIRIFSYSVTRINRFKHSWCCTVYNATWSPINYQVRLRFGCNESLHLHRPFVGMIKDPWFAVCSLVYFLMHLNESSTRWQWKSIITWHIAVWTENKNSRKPRQKYPPHGGTLDICLTWKSTSMCPWV